MTSHHWQMSVADVTGRPDRDLTVRVEDDRVILTVPPPGTARLTGEEASLLIEFLRAGRDEVFRKSAPPPERPGR